MSEHTGITTIGTGFKKPIPLSKIHVETSDYEAAHGHRPRGFGSWAFAIGRDESIKDLFWVHRATYSHAKALALGEAQRRNEFIVIVQS